MVPELEPPRIVRVKKDDKGMKIEAGSDDDVNRTLKDVFKEKRKTWSSTHCTVQYYMGTV